MDSMGKTDTRTEDSDLFTDKLVLDIIKQTVVDIEDLKMSLYMWDAQELHMYGDHGDEFKLGLITKGKAEEYLEMFFNLQLKSTKSFWGTQDLPPALSEEEGQDKDVMIPKTRSSSNCSTGSSPASSSSSSASYDEHSKNIVIPATSSSKCSTFEVTHCLSPTMTENEETHRLAPTSTAGLTEATQHSIYPPLVGEDLRVFTHHITQSFKMLGEQGENNDCKKVMTPESQERIFEETCSVCPALLEIKDNHNLSPALSKTEGHEEDSRNIPIPEVRSSSKCSNKSEDTSSPLPTVIAVSEMEGSCSMAIEETKTCSLFPSSSVKSPALLKQGEHDEENMMISATISSPECYTNSEKEIQTAFPASTTPMFNPEMEDICSQAFEETKTCSLFPTASENEETHSYPPAMSDKVGHDKDSKHVMIPDTRSSSKCSAWSELKKKTASPASSLAVFTPKMADRWSQDFEQTDTCSLFPRLSENEKTLSLSSAFPDKGKHEECTKKGMNPGRRSSPNCFTRFQMRGKMFSPASSLPTTTAVSTSEWRDKCHQAFKETRILSPPLSQKEGHKGDSKNIMIPEKSTLSKRSNISEVSRNTCSPLPTITAALKMEESSSQDFEETVTCKPFPALSENEEALTLPPGLLEKGGHEQEDTKERMTHVTRSSSICSTRSLVGGETSSPTSSLSICTAMSTLEPADSYFQVSKETCSLSPPLSEQKGHEGDNKSVPKTRTSSKCSTTSEAWRNTPSPLPTVAALSEKGGDDEDSPNSMIPTSRLCSIGSDMMGETVFPASSSRTALSTPEMSKGSSQAFEGTQKLSPAYSKLEGHQEDSKNDTRPSSRSPTKSIMGIKIDSSDSSISSAASLTEATLCSISPAMVNDNLRIYTHRLARCFKMLQKQGDKDRKKLRSPETPSSPMPNASLPTTTAVTIPKLADICLQAFEETCNLTSALLESKDTHSRSPALSEKEGNDEDSKNISIPETRSSSKCSARSEVRKKTASRPSSTTEFTPDIADSCTQALKENDTCSLFTALSKNEETLSLTPALSEMYTYDEDGKKTISPVTQSSHCSPKSQLRGKTSSPASSLQTTTAVSTPELADSCRQETGSLSQHLSERQESDGDSKNIMIPETSTSSKCSTKTEVNTKSAFLASTSPTSTAVFTTKTADSCFQALEETQNCSLFLAISENNKTYSHSPALSEKGRLDEDSSTIMISRSSSKCSTRSDVRQKKVFPASSSLTELFTPEMAKSCSQTFEETHSLSSVMAENGGTLRLSPALSELEGHEDNRKTVMVPDTSSSSSTRSEISIKNDSSDSSLSSTAELTEATLRNISPSMVDEDLRRYTHRLAQCFKMLQKRGDKNSKKVSSPETRSSPTCSNRARVWGKTALPNSSLPISAKAPTSELADSFLQAFEETCNLFPALLRIKETHSLTPALLEKEEHKRDSKNITIPPTRTSSKHCSEVSRNTPSPLPTIIAVSDMEDSCSQASCFTPAKSATSSSTTSSTVSNPKTVHSCSQAFEESSSLSPATLEREGHGKDSKIVLSGTDPYPSGFGNKKIVSSSTLPTTAALSEIALQGMSPGAVDEDLRWFTHRLAHYFIMLEKEEYGDKKSVICDVPQQQPESGKQQKSAWRKFFHARRNNKIHPLSHEDLKEDSTATSAQSSAREDPCQSKDDTAELQKKRKKSVWGKFFHTRQNEVQPHSQEDQKAESVTPSTPTSERKEPCQPKDEILEKQKKPLWRKFVPARRNGTEQDPSSSHEDQREDPCSPSAPPLTTVDPCLPKNETHEQQKKEIKWKSAWWNFFCPRKKNKIHPFPQDDPS